MALSGLKDITHLTVMHQLDELTYLAADGRHRSAEADGALFDISQRFESMVVDLYRKFIEYQLQLWYACHGNRVQRFAKDISSPSVWKCKLEEVHKVHGQLRDAMQALDSRLIEDIPSKLEGSLDRGIVAALTESPSVPNYPEAVPSEYLMRIKLSLMLIEDRHLRMVLPIRDGSQESRRLSS